MSAIVAALPTPSYAQGQVAVRSEDEDGVNGRQVLLEKPVTVRVSGVSVRGAIDAVAAAAKVRVGYQPELVSRVAKQVTFAAERRPLREVFAQILAGTRLQVSAVSSTQLVIVERDSSSVGNSVGVLTGTVRDSANRRALSGATVKIEGMKQSVVTADDGTFALREVPIGDHVLIVRSFGYRPVTRPVTVRESAAVNVNIVMTTAPTVLSGVVTTATGMQRKIEVGSDIVNLNVDSIMKVAPITSVTDLLESRVPGLTVLHSSGNPGDPSRLRLRGPKSINGSNDPIMIIDGVRAYAAQSDRRTANLAGVSLDGAAIEDAKYTAPSPLDQLDPNTIETIEVLKGPNASALYGSDAANGVIIVTTKRGRAGPARWSTTIGQGRTSMPGHYPVQTIRWAHDALGRGGLAQSQPCSITNLSCNVVDSVTSLQILNLPQWSPFGTGRRSDGSVTLSGGVPALTYSLTGSAATELGYAKLPQAMADAFEQAHGYEVPGWAKRPTRYTTWGGGGQVTAQPTPTIQVSLQSNLFHGLQQRSSLEQLMASLIGTVDTLSPAGGGVPAYRNAYERASDEQLTFTNAVQLGFAPWRWLPLSATLGLSIMNGHDVTLLGRNLVPVIPDDPRLAGGDTIGHYGVAEKSSSLKTLDVNTTLPGWNGRLRTALGFNLYSTNSTDIAARQDTLGLGVTVPASLSGKASQQVTGASTYGWFFEPRFSASERFFLTPGFRLDGGNAGGGSARVSGLPAKLTFAALFPKVNFSWVAIDRQGDQRPLFGMFTLLRPRLAIGSAGVQPSPGDKLRLLRTKAGDTLELAAMGNTQLRPERSSEVEGGLDAELWGGRISTILTRSRQVRRDAIIQVGVAPSVYGGASIALNIGEIQNTSTELSGSVRPLETSAISWTVGASYSKNDNVVLKLDQASTAILRDPAGGGQGASSFGVTDSRIAVGYPLFGRWAKPILSYADANGNGIIEPSEIGVGDTAVYLGRQDPAYTATLTTDLTLLHGRLGVHANFSRDGGFSQLNYSAGNNGTFLSVANQPTATWGQQAAYVAASQGLTYYGLAQTVSSWRFQSLSINYVAPQTIARWFRAPRMSVALQGSNLGLWTNYRGKDPNVNAFPNGNAAADGGQLPEPRVWKLQLTLGN